MEAEDLRSTYNKYFSQRSNAWSSTDFSKTRKVAARTVGWLRALGFRDNANATLLDVGCATGFYTEAFRTLGFNVTGLDYSDVAVELAKKEFPACTFVQMNGFDPVFQNTFDVIFCRGFSGVNTHDLSFIAGWVNKYMSLLSPGGFFVLSYSSDFSGKEKENETVNMSKDEIASLIKLIDGHHRGTKIFYYFPIVSRIKRAIERRFQRKKVKDYYYIFLQKAL